MADSSEPAFLFLYRKEAVAPVDYLSTFATAPCRTDVQRVVEAWNQLGVNPISRMTSTSTRYKMISARIKEYGIDDVLKAIQKINSSTFLKGGGNRGWMIDFEWFARPNNFPKVLEGQYDDKNKSGSLEGWLNE